MTATPTPEANTLVSGARTLLDLGRRTIPNRGPGERAAPTREPTPAPLSTAPTRTPETMPRESEEPPAAIVVKTTEWPLWYAFLLLLILLLMALALFFLLRRRRRNRQPARRYY